MPETISCVNIVKTVYIYSQKQIKKNIKDYMGTSIWIFDIYFTLL